MKTVRVIPPSENIEKTLQEKREDMNAAVEIAAEITKAKPPKPYEKRLEKMSNSQLRGEIRKGQKGKLSGYVSVPLAIVLGTILDSHEKGMKPFIS